MLRAIKIVALIFFPILAEAQLLKKVEDIFTAEPKLTIRLDSRNSFVTTQNVKMVGIKAGLEFEEKYKLGLGYYWLSSKITEDITVQTASEQLKVYPARLKYRYMAFHFEYVFYKKDNWEFSAPFQLGAGSSFYKYRNEFNKRRKEDYGPALSIAPGAEASYLILPWLSFGLGIGYHIMLINNPNIDERFTAPTYVIKLNIVPKPFLEQVRKWTGK